MATGWIGPGGRYFEPLLLGSESEDGLVIAAVAALSYGRRSRQIAGTPILRALAAALLDNGDVDAVTCIT